MRGYREFHNKFTSVATVLRINITLSYTLAACKSEQQGAINIYCQLMYV